MYIDSLTYEQFMMLGDAELSRGFSMQDEAEQKAKIDREQANLSYFRRKRMEKAAELLEETNMKATDVASFVGYENQGKFAKVFVDMYGVTPLEFRRLSK